MSKILIIEDDSDLREGLAFALELEGYETAQARTLRDARALLEETPRDLLLLDCADNIHGFRSFYMLNT